MVDLRAKAKGQRCLIRLPGCQQFGEKTCGAHYRLAGYAGGGMKPDDFAFLAWSCDHCHDVVDGRKDLPGHDREVVRLAHAEGVLRTQAELVRDGTIKT